MRKSNILLKMRVSWKPDTIRRPDRLAGRARGGLPTRARNRPEGLSDEIRPDSRFVRPAEDALDPAPRVPLGRLGRLRECACRALARLRSRRPAEAYPRGNGRPKTLLEFRIERHMRVVH